MKKTLIFNLILLFLFLFISVPEEGIASDEPPLLLKKNLKAVISDLETDIPDLMEKARIPGLQIAVIGDGKVVWQRGFGFKNAATRAPVTNETIFLAASLTKPIFAYAVMMMMVDEGLIDLDKPLHTYLTREKIEKELGNSLDAKGFKRDWFEKITGRHVLSHSVLVFPVLANFRAGKIEYLDTRKFQAQIEEAFRNSRIPGLVFALREPDGRIFTGAVGTSDIAKGTPMRTDSSFYIGSISQSMLAAVIFMLEEENKLGLDDSISDFVEFPGGGAVTVEMLLDHSSGFADWTGRDLVSTDNPRLPELLKSPQTIDSLIKIAAAGKPVYPPGERQEACYTNMLLLTKLIENVEGKPASAVLEERIFKPLGMTNTRYLKAGEELRSLAGGYRAEKGWGQPLECGLTEVGWADDNLRALADQGIVSTAGDVLKYHVGLREGELISPKSLERMRTVRPGKINGLGYLVLKGKHGTWEGNTGHAVGHLSINLFHVDKGFYLVVMGNLGDTGLPVAKLYNIRYGN